jgi:hypothetical protein
LPAGVKKHLQRLLKKKPSAEYGCLVAGYDATDPQDGPTNLKQDEQTEEQRFELLGIYKFDGKGGFQVDTGGHDAITGAIQIEEKEMQFKPQGAYSGKNRYWSFISATDTTMKVLADWPGKETSKVKYELMRLRENPKFDIAEVSWKKPLDSNATKEQLKDRLRTQLLYYANYFQTMTDHNINVFAPGKMLLPLKLYGGGVGLKSIDGTPKWLINMGSRANAEQAYEMLRGCFKAKLEFPDHGDNYLQEYVDVLKHLTNQLPFQ